MADPAGIHRLGQLDSLRGVAAFSVVLLHFYELWIGQTPQLPRWERRLLFVLHPFYSGFSAVILFFVLSGFVLSLPYLRGKEQPYTNFILRRILRIYGPYLAALTLALIGVAVLHNSSHRVNWSETMWSAQVDGRLVVQHILFLGEYDWTRYDFILWSLVQEMRVSLLFPIIAWLIIRLGTAFSLAVAIVITTIAYFIEPAGYSQREWISFTDTTYIIAFFIAGIVLASRQAAIQQWWNSLLTQWRVLFAVASLALYSYVGDLVSPRLEKPILGHLINSGQHRILENELVLLGSIGLIILAISAARVRHLLSARPIRFLGRISYSLYLIHPIVLLTLALTIGDRIPLSALFAVYLFAALLFSWIFCILIEERFITWSRKVRV